MVLTSPNPNLLGQEQVEVGEAQDPATAFFTSVLCCVQDGFLDSAEVAQWVLPGEVDHADNEAKHLIHETDTDKVIS